MGSLIFIPIGFVLMRLGWRMRVLAHETLELWQENIRTNAIPLHHLPDDMPKQVSGMKRQARQGVFAMVLGALIFAYPIAKLLWHVAADR